MLRSTIKFCILLAHGCDMSSHHQTRWSLSGDASTTPESFATVRGCNANGMSSPRWTRFTAAAHQVGRERHDDTPKPSHCSQDNPCAELHHHPTLLPFFLTMPSQRRKNLHLSRERKQLQRKSMHPHASLHEQDRATRTN